MYQFMVSGNGRMDTFGVVSASTLGSTASAANAINSKGAWVTIGDITQRKYEFLFLNVAQRTAGSAAFFIDFGIGPSGANVNSIYALVENIPMSGRGGVDNWNPSYPLPIHVPMSKQMQIRCSATRSAAALHATVAGFTNGVFGKPGYSRGITVGVVSASTLGSSVDAGGTANTKGTAVVLSSAAPCYSEAILAIIGDAGDVSRAAATFFLDVIVSSRLSVDNFMFGQGAIFNVPTPAVSHLFPVQVSSGERIAARTQCSINTTGDRVIDLALILFA